MDTIDTNLDSLIALLVATAAIFAMMVGLYRHGALAPRGFVTLCIVLFTISGFLAFTLR